MQTAYNFFPGAAVSGMLYDAAGSVDIVTRVAAVAIPFGNFVVKAAGDDNVALPSASASASSVIEGVAVYTQDTQSGLAGDGVAPAYPIGRPINTLQEGRIWVYCETAFNPDSDTLYVRYTANGAGKVPGQVRNDTDSGKADELGVSGYGVAYKALNTLTAAGFLALDINLPSQVR
jgi:hypothetical protein